jgi:hypothetical protein
VFEGNAPADVRENLPLNARAEKTGPSKFPCGRRLAGRAEFHQRPDRGDFPRQSGSNLLVVGQSEERTTTILAVALVSLAAQFPPADARFVLLDSTPPGFPQREISGADRSCDSARTTLAGNGELTEVMGRLAEELKQRAEKESSGPEIFVLVHGLQNFKKLRQEDEFSFFSRQRHGNSRRHLAQSDHRRPGARHPPDRHRDTYNNVTRFLGRKALTEFEMRVVFQMSASDSASLIDAPDAATLGLHRALYYNDREGTPGNLPALRAARQRAVDFNRVTIRGMKEFLTVLTAVLPVFGIMGIGLWLRRRNWLSADADASLMRVTINLLLPALIFDSVLGNAALRRPENLLVPPLVGFGMVAVGLGVARLFARVAGLKTKPEQRTFAFLAGLQNYAYLTIPLCITLFDSGTTGVLFVHNVGAEMAMWTLCIAVLTGSGLAGSWKKMLNAPLRRAAAGGGPEFSRPVGGAARPGGAGGENHSDRDPLVRPERDSAGAAAHRRDCGGSPRRRGGGRAARVVSVAAWCGWGSCRLFLLLA